MSASYASSAPARDTTTPVTLPPPASVSSLTTSASTSNVTFGAISSGRTAIVSASDLACTMHG